jgi:hypothetical protein
MKTVYGEHRTWHKHFWAYAVTNGKVVLVRCRTIEDAKEEKERMKHSTATTVGYTPRQVEELTVRQEMKSRGWKIEVIR